MLKVLQKCDNQAQMAQAQMAQAQMALANSIF
jgi:hypothetical protein